MWIITSIGFFSIVRKPEDVASGTLTVRARVRGDLEALRQACPELGEIEESPHSDYRFRARGPKAAVGAAIGRLAEGIDYDNFKDAVGARQGRGRAEVYHGVWDVLYGLQRGGGVVS
jgi:hypothetical protein